MSYILDAIRKSEQQRQRAAVPTLRNVQVPASEENKQSFLLIGLVAAILVLLGILIGWLVFWRQSVSNSTPVQLSSNASLSPRTVTQFVPAPRHRNDEIAVPQQLASISNRPVNQDSRDNNAKLEAPVKPERKEQAARLRSARSNTGSSKTMVPPESAGAAKILAKQDNSPDRESAVHAGSREPSGDSNVVSLEELPPSIRKEIPEIAISGYTYSNSSRERIVGINDRLLQEGDFVIRGLKLERIGQKGLIFSYKNYYFSKSF